MSLNTQWLTMAMMLVSGLGMGVLFDSYRVVSHELRFSRWLLPVLDLVYWVGTTLTVFRVLYASNNGEVRAYVFLGLLIGIGFYFLLFSKSVIALVRGVIEAVRRLISLLLRCVDVLIIKPFVMLYRLLRVLIGFLIVLTIFLVRIVLQLVRPFWLLLRWILRPLTKPIGAWIVRLGNRYQLKQRATGISETVISIWRKISRGGKKE